MILQWQNPQLHAIYKNEHVQELLAMLKDKDSGYKDALFIVLAHIGKMETQYEKMVMELSGMRQALAEAERQRHPIKNAMQNTVIEAQSKLLDFRDTLARLKQTIIDGCKAAIAT